MKVSFVLPADQFSHKIVDEFENFGFEVLRNYCTDDCDFIIGISHSQLNTIARLNYFFPKIPMINYNWDLYGWVDVSSSSGYNWKGYGELLKKTLEIWTPSKEVNLRTEEFFGLGNRCKVIKSYARLFEYNGDIRDERYIFQPMRYYKHDKNFGWLKRACIELDIPLYESLHKLSEPEFQKKIAECSFLVTEYHEASTGGLTLLEGYRLGKPVVVSDSKYMGARDYFGDRAIYFKDGDYADFKNTIKQVWGKTPILDIQDCREFTDRYSVNYMVSEMVERLRFLKQERDNIK